MPVPNGFERFERILVPVDFSQRSANALAYAVALGSIFRASIDVLHVWHSDLSTPVTVARERAKSELRDFVSGLELRGDVELRRRAELGDAYLTIQRMAQLTGYDLLVIAGPDAQRNSADSVALALLRSAATPVLFIPEHCQARLRSEREPVLRLERILVPLALAGTQLSALDCACELADADGARVEALLTLDAAPEQLQRLRARPEPRVTEFELHQDSEKAAPARVHSSRSDWLIVASKRVQVGERATDLRLERIALSVPCATLSLPD
jgi:nucleotide-binding universal stress UspA family protein